MREHLCLSKAFCPDYRYTLYLLYTSGLSLKSLILSQRVIGVVLLTLALFWDFAEWFNKTLAQWKDSTQEVEGCVCFFIKNTFFRLCIYFISSVMVHSSDNIPTFIISVLLGAIAMLLTHPNFNTTFFNLAENLSGRHPIMQTPPTQLCKGTPSGFSIQKVV